ncbi:MAG: alpha/beta hydrolase [Planctomycetota bacterium]|nr:alpha/beta hydrolase [Planctomycetota bacterium]
MPHRTAAVAVISLAALLGGCASTPVSQLTPQERAAAVEIAQSIDAAKFPDAIVTPVASTQDVKVPAGHGTVNCRIYHPLHNERRGTVVLIHGGAFVGGSVDYHDNMARAICNAAQAGVISIDYSRAPDAMFPMQLDQIHAVIDWLKTPQAARLGLDGHTVALCGDSAGGNLAAVVAREWKTADGSLALVALINPVVDATGSTIKDQETLGFTQLMAKAYLPAGVAPTSPRVSPLLHPVPPRHAATFIAIGDEDPWRAEQEQYAAKLRTAGVKVEVLHAKTGHLGPDGSQATPLAMPILTEAGKAIRTAFASR